MKYDFFKKFLAELETWQISSCWGLSSKYSESVGVTDNPDHEILKLTFNLPQVKGKLRSSIKSSLRLLILGN